MSKPDIIYECHESVTSYRLRPNPYAGPSTGFVHGAVMEWNDGDEWAGHFFIGPESLEAMGIALLGASKDVAKEQAQ